jgi:hypothetical protein
MAKVQLRAHNKTLRVAHQALAGVGGPGPPAACYRFMVDRKDEHPPAAPAARAPHRHQNVSSCSGHVASGHMLLSITACLPYWSQ